MSQAAPHLEDHVIPYMPVRQWAVSVPIPLCVLLAAQPEPVTPVLVAHQDVATWALLRAAKAMLAAVVQSPRTPPCPCPHRINRARQLKHVFDIDMQHCPNCGAGELKIIAAILERPVIEKILSHLGLDPQPPPRGRAREAGQK